MFWKYVETTTMQNYVELCRNNYYVETTTFTSIDHYVYWINITTRCKLSKQKSSMFFQLPKDELKTTGSLEARLKIANGLNQVLRGYMADSKGIFNRRIGILG